MIILSSAGIIFSFSRKKKIINSNQHYSTKLTSMKQKSTLFFFCTISILIVQCRSGLITTSNSCYNSIQQGQAANKVGNYSSALDIFDGVLKKCDAFDAKEKGYAGKAAALNGMRRYNEALDVSNQGLNINKTSIDNLFEKATAEFGLNRPADA